MPLSFTPEAQQKIDAIRARYPNAQAACLPVLHLAQDEFGYPLRRGDRRRSPRTLELPSAHVYGVVDVLHDVPPRPDGEARRS